MTYLLTGLLYISSILIVVAILLQPHKSEGLSSYNSSESNIFGVSADGGPLAKMTAFLAAMIGLIILGLHYFL
jgi:protein translocase SecG subunit